MLETRKDIEEEIRKVLPVYARLLKEAIMSPDECIVRLFVVKKNKDVIGIFACKSDVGYYPLPSPGGPFVNGYKFFTLAQRIFRNSGFNEDYATYDEEVEFMLRKGTGEWNHKEYLKSLDERIKNGEIERGGRPLIQLIKDNLKESAEEISDALAGGFIEEILRNYPFTSTLFESYELYQKESNQD